METISKKNAVPKMSRTEMARVADALKDAKRRPTKTPPASPEETLSYLRAIATHAQTAPLPATETPKEER